LEAALLSVAGCWGGESSGVSSWGDLRLGVVLGRCDTDRELDYSSFGRGAVGLAIGGVCVFGQRLSVSSGRMISGTKWACSPTSRSMVAHGSSDLGRGRAQPGSAPGEAPAVDIHPPGEGEGDGHDKKLTLPPAFASPGTSGDGSRGPDGRGKLSPDGRAVMRQLALRQEIEAKVREELKRRLVRARLVAEVAAAEDAKRTRAERPPALPAPVGRGLALAPREHSNGRHEARPAARRASNTTGGSSDSDGGESEPGPPSSGLTPSLALTGPRAALALRIAAWEARGGLAEVHEFPILWRVRAGHCRRLERLGVFDEPAERGRPGWRRPAPFADGDGGARSVFDGRRT
jgi:hypothetical protein